MPRATAVASEPERFDLKSLDEGFVVLRKLTYGEMLHRRDLSARITPKGKRDEDVEVGINQMSIVLYEFSRAIVEHNLEDDNGKLLDFRITRHVEMLDPRVAQEIEGLIIDMNRPPDEDDSKSDGKVDTGSSQVVPK
jgi:hypothetical protein